MILTTALMLMQLQPDDPRDAWIAPPFRNQVGSFATFSVRRAFEDVTTEIVFATSDSVLRGHYLIRRRLVAGDNQQAEYAYTNSRDCPGAIAVMRRLRRLRMPQPAVPYHPGDDIGIVVTDGASYVLEGRALHPGAYLGDYRITSNVGTPLAHWADTMLTALQPCWSPVARH